MLQKNPFTEIGLDSLNPDISAVDRCYRFLKIIYGQICKCAKVSLETEGDIEDVITSWGLG